MKRQERDRDVILYQPPIVWILLIGAVAAAVYFFLVQPPSPPPPRGQLPPEVFVGSPQLPSPEKPPAPEAVSNVYPAWSPDGTRIAFVSDRHGNWELYLVHVGTLQETRVTESDAADEQPAWTPGGDLLAFASNRDRQGCRNLYLIHPETKQVTRVTFRIKGCDLFPSWTPTTIKGEISKKVVFASDRDDGKGEIYVVNIDTFAFTRVTFREGQPDLHPTISPDGSKIAFQSFVEGNWEIFVMDSDGRNIKQLTFNPADDVQPAWSPDGQRIAFASKRDGNWEIYTMDPEGRNIKNLTLNVADDMKPTWSPDTKEIAFQSNRTGRWEIWKMKAADGTEQKQLTGLK